MDQQVFISLMQQMVWLIFLLSAPILLITMVVGVIISIFQAVTQIQEQTLTFVPKIVAALLILAITGPWMVDMMLNYTNDIFETMTEVARK